MKVVILGAGSVAAHITQALLESAIDVGQIYNRTLEHAQAIAKPYNLSYTDKISEIQKADLYIIAVSDDSVTEVSYHIPFDDCLVVHTAGSLGIEALKGDYRKGVVYPLQNFTSGIGVRHEKVPYLIESLSDEDYQVLYKLFTKISEKVYRVNADQRLKMQLAGVFVSSFVNLLYNVGEELCTDADLPFSILIPAIEETAMKVRDVNPSKVYPLLALNNEEKTIEKHLELLKNKESISRLYQQITAEINKRK